MCSNKHEKRTSQNEVLAGEFRFIKVNARCHLGMHTYRRFFAHSGFFHEVRIFLVNGLSLTYAHENAYLTRWSSGIKRINTPKKFRFARKKKLMTHPHRFFLGGTDFPFKWLIIHMCVRKTYVTKWSFAWGIAVYKGKCAMLFRYAYKHGNCRFTHVFPPPRVCFKREEGQLFNRRRFDLKTEDAPHQSRPKDLNCNKFLTY